MISVTDLRSGTAFLMDGQPWAVVRYEHIKMGRGSAQIKVKVKNLKTGVIVEKTFQNGGKVEEVTTVRRPMQFLYRDGRDYVFMDNQTYEQNSLDEELLLDQFRYLKEGITVSVIFLDESGELQPLSIELPPKMEFTIAETDPGVKGDSAVNIYKPAILENGLKVKIPLFISEGEKISIDTRTGEYAGKVSG